MFLENKCLKCPCEFGGVEEQTRGGTRGKQRGRGQLLQILKICFSKIPRKYYIWIKNPVSNSLCKTV